MAAGVRARRRSTFWPTSSFPMSGTTTRDNQAGKNMSLKFTVGDLTIHRVIEQETTFLPALDMLPGLTPEVLAQNREWMQKAGALDDKDVLILCFQSYVVKTPHHTILIDSCIGNDKPRPLRPKWNMKTDDLYMRGLAAAGFAVNQIDYVMCTHLHVDHVGWNTRLENGRWVPTFPNAKYLFADRELAFWTERHKHQPEACPWISDSVLPIVEAKRFELVKSNHSLNDLVHLVPIPGHTIDHYSVRVGKVGADAFITGDMVHSPLQMRYPELGMNVGFQLGSGRPNAAGAVHTTQRYPYGRVHRAVPIAASITRWDNVFRFLGTDHITVRRHLASPFVRRTVLHLYRCW